MTRNEFLSRLRRGLEGLSPDYIQDVMNDYESHFTDGLANGRTEYEISHALGEAWQRQDGGARQQDCARGHGFPQIMQQRGRADGAGRDSSENQATMTAQLSG
jgi:hypothetical protein